MEDTAWYNLYNELSSDIIITLKENVPFVNICDGECAINGFRKYIYGISNRFIGECRQNIEERNQVPAFFNDLHFKLIYLFNQQFGINFTEENIPYPLLHNGQIIPAVNSSHDPYISVVHSKIFGFSMSITFLKQQLNSLTISKNNRRIRIQADIYDFRTTLLINRQLIEIFEIGKRLGLFSPDTNLKDFVDIFSGRPAVNPINWTSSVYSLYKFINGINGKGINKLTDGKWHVISRLFVVDGHKVQEDSLLHPSIGKNDQLEKVDKLIAYFNTPEELEY